MPEVSIIIPTYNRAKFIDKTIESVLKQTFKDFELIIVDDGSIDDTKIIVEKYIKKDSRIRYIYQKNSGGTSVPRNIGIENSNGKYLAFLDSDDRWLPEKLEKQISFFKNTKDEKLGFLDCDALVIKEDDGTDSIKYELPDHYRGNVFEKILKNNFILTPSGIIIKKEVLEIIGKFDENFKMITDWDLYLRISKNYNFDFINEPLFEYYVHKDNITKTMDRKEITDEVIDLFEKHKKYYSQYYPSLYIDNLNHFALLYCKSGQTKLGRKFFIKIIKEDWRYYKIYFHILLSFLGSSFYIFFFKARRKIFGRKIEPEEKNLKEFPEQIFSRIFELENLKSNEK